MWVERAWARGVGARGAALALEEWTWDRTRRALVALLLGGGHGVAGTRLERE